MRAVSRKIYTAIIITLTVLLFSANVVFPSPINSRAYLDYKKAWNYVDNGNLKKAQELVYKNYKTKKGDYKVYWLVIQSTIYLLQNDYKNTLKSIDPFRHILKERYYFLKNNPDEESKLGKDLITWNFKKMLIISSTANFKLGNWLAALNNMLEETANGFGNDNYSLKAVCFYHTKNFPEALINFQYAYKTAESKKMRAEAAYDVACIYSILNDPNHAIKWLKIPLKHDRKFWLPKIYKEKNFDKIRNNQKFQTFLKEQEHIFNQGRRDAKPTK